MKCCRQGGRPGVAARGGRQRWDSCTGETAGPPACVALALLRTLRSSAPGRRLKTAASAKALRTIYVLCIFLVFLTGKCPHLAAIPLVSVLRCPAPIACSTGPCRTPAPSLRRACWGGRTGTPCGAPPLPRSPAEAATRWRHLWVCGPSTRRCMRWSRGRNVRSTLLRVRAQQGAGPHAWPTYALAMC